MGIQPDLILIWGTQEILEFFRNFFKMLQKEIHYGQMVQIDGHGRAIVVTSGKPALYCSITTGANTGDDLVSH
ncbi:hypothetical protein LYNGBM3L_17690 [Moorena producens 3L]|uniref:Uncharacterized protein n=1 Tax=Moorena producens 3L TaxID=489825 RepID=F4XSI3_9CYAN|nr:hypothetical protein LYNGBM3L_17690 [Moorena producens 3L]